MSYPLPGADVAVLNRRLLKDLERAPESRAAVLIAPHSRPEEIEPVHSPLIPEGAADLMLAFEPLEALRQISQTRKGAKVLVEERRIPPVTVSTGACVYPEDCLERLLASGREVRVIPALERAVALGEPRAANTVMLGALAALLDLPAEAWEAALRAGLKPKALDVNLKAFADGRALT